MVGLNVGERIGRDRALVHTIHAYLRDRISDVGRYRECAIRRLRNYHGAGWSDCSTGSGGRGDCIRDTGRKPQNGQGIRLHRVVERQTQARKLRLRRADIRRVGDGVLVQYPMPKSAWSPLPSPPGQPVLVKMIGVLVRVLEERFTILRSMSPVASSRVVDRIEGGIGRIIGEVVHQPVVRVALLLEIALNMSARERRF